LKSLGNQTKLQAPDLALDGVVSELERPKRGDGEEG